MKSVANKEMIKITLVLVCNYNYFLYGVQIIILLFIEKLSPFIAPLKANEINIKCELFKLCISSGFISKLSAIKKNQCLNLQCYKNRRPFTIKIIVK